MFTGEGNPYNLSKISLVNGKRLLNFWGGDAPEAKDNQCNVVKGSDGSTFNPYIKKVSKDRYSFMPYSKSLKNMTLILISFTMLFVLFYRKTRYGFLMTNYAGPYHLFLIKKLSPLIYQATVSFQDLMFSRHLGQPLKMNVFVRMRIYVM